MWNLSKSCFQNHEAVKCDNFDLWINDWWCLISLLIFYYHCQLNYCWASSIKKSVKEQKLRAKKPWITKGILISINNKNKTYILKVLPNKRKNQTRLLSLFKKNWNSINKIIKVSKAKYYHQYFNINKRNLLKVWEGIKEIIHCKSNTGQTVNSLRINGSLSTNQNQIANSFNTFFCNIPKEIEKKLIPATTTYSCLTDPAKNSLNSREANRWKRNICKYICLGNYRNSSCMDLHI